MSDRLLQDLQIPRRAAGFYVLAFTVFTAGLLMVSVVAVTDRHWTLLIVAAVLLCLGLFAAAGEGYRLRQTKHGRVEVHTLFRVKRIDLTRGFEVTGRRVVRVKTPATRVRLSATIGGPIAVREWLEVAASR